MNYDEIILQLTNEVQECNTRYGVMVPAYYKQELRNAIDSLTKCKESFDELAEPQSKPLMLSDLLLEQIKNYDPYNKKADGLGFVTRWVAKNNHGDVVAVGDTKAECQVAARKYVASENMRNKAWRL